MRSSWGMRVVWRSQHSGPDVTNNTSSTLLLSGDICSELLCYKNLQISRSFTTLRLRRHEARLLRRTLR